MKCQVLLPADVRQRVQIVDSAGIDGTGRAYNEEWQETRVTILLNRGAQRFDIHAMQPVRFDPAQRIRAEARHVHRFCNASMGSP